MQLLQSENLNCLLWADLPCQGSAIYVWRWRNWRKTWRHSHIVRVLLEVSGIRNPVSFHCDDYTIIWYRLSDIHIALCLRRRTKPSGPMGVELQMPYLQKQRQQWHMQVGFHKKMLNSISKSKAENFDGPLPQIINFLVLVQSDSAIRSLHACRSWRRVACLLPTENRERKNITHSNRCFLSYQQC